MHGHTDGSVLNNDSERPGRGSRTPVALSSSSSSQPVAVGCAAGRPGWAEVQWALTRQGRNIGSDSKHCGSDRAPGAPQSKSASPKAGRPGPTPESGRARGPGLPGEETGLLGVAGAAASGRVRSMMT